jgi:hypothetical protein
MKTKKSLIIILIVSGLLIANFSSALALPPLPSSFWGTVKVDGSNVPLDTKVSAWINGVKYAEATVILDGGETWYALDVPGDDPETGLIEGGVTGDYVVFHIGTLVTTVTAPWQTGKNVRLDLNVDPTAVTLVDLQASDDNPFFLPMVLLMGVIGLVMLMALGWMRVRKTRLY